MVILSVLLVLAVLFPETVRKMLGIKRPTYLSAKRGIDGKLQW